MLTSVVLFIAIAVNCALIGVILTYTKPTQPGRNFIWFLLGLSCWILGEALIDLPGASKAEVIWWARTMHVTGGVALVAWVWFCYDITGRRPRVRKVLVSLSLPILPILCLAWGTYFIRDAVKPPWGDYLITGSLELYYMLWTLLMGCTGIGILLYTARRARGHLRLQLIYILLGMTFLLVGDVVTCLVLPVFFSTMEFSRLGPLASIIMTSMVTYAVARYRLMDIRIVLRTGLTYLLTGLCTLLLTMFFLQFVVTLLHHDRVFRLDALAVTLILVVAILIHPIWRLSSYLAGKILVKLPYNYEETLERASTRLTAAYERQAVVDIVSETIQRALRPLGFRLYFAGLSPRDAWEEHCFGLEPAVGSILPLVKELFDGAPHDQVIFTEYLLRDPDNPSPQAEQLVAQNVALVCLMMAQGTVSGMLCLAEKSSGEIYNDRDITLIHSLANYAAMALQSTKSYETVNKLNQQLEERVKERTNALSEANDQLQQANEALRKADHTKNEFLAYVSHELLTPLTCILGWAQAAEYQPQKEIIEKALGIITSNAMRQKRLIDELLLISRIIHNQYEVHFTTVDFRELTQQAAESFEVLMLEKHIDFQITIPEESILLKGDGPRLTQVVENLLKNALKFTESGGTVRLAITVIDEAVRLTVTDTGRGIDQAILPKIFNPFMQDKRDERYGGLGLGLAVVKGVVELHGGTVLGESNGRGCGSQFTVTLPLVAALNDDVVLLSLNPLDAARK